MKKYPFTFFSGVNTLFNALLNAPAFADVNFSELRSNARRRHGSAGLCRRELAESHRKGHYTGWGLTETSPPGASIA
jgi:long-chain acyl-CoA synthetase